MLLLACARGQVDLDAQFEALQTDVDRLVNENPFAGFPDPEPLVVVPNRVGFFERAVVTSPLPVWALAVVGGCSALAAVALITLIFALVSGREGPAKKSVRIGFVVLAAVLLAASVAGIATALVLGMRQPTPTGLQRGATISLERAVARVVSVGQDTASTPGTLWLVTALDAAGAETQVYYVQDAGLAVSAEATGDGGALPRPNVPLSCSLSVVDGGKVVLTQWTLLPAAASRAASVGTKRLAVYRIRLANGDCGGVACDAACPADSLRKMLIDGPLSMANFYRTASLERFVIGAVDFYEATIPDNTPTFSALSKINEFLGGAKTADFHMMYFPLAYKRDQFSGNAAGYGTVGGTSSWMRK